MPVPLSGYGEPPYTWNVAPAGLVALGKSRTWTADE
jgi:hypothetical protein